MKIPSHSPNCRLHGSYEALKYGTLLDGLADLTGGITESIPIKAENGPIRPAIMYSLLDTTSIVTCTVNNSALNNGTPATTQIGAGNRSPSADKLSNGINVNTNYRLCSLDKAETLMGDSVQLVRLRDPMAMATFGTTSGYNGDWSSLSGTWERVSIQERDRLLGQLDIGEFWISFLDLTQIFSHLECVHLDSDTARDEPSLADKTRKWMMRMFQGAWRKGVTAGGCRNNPDSFHINPQLQLFLTEKEDVIISLNQHSVMEPKVIGFTLYNLSNSEWGRVESGRKLICLSSFQLKQKSPNAFPNRSSRSTRAFSTHSTPTHGRLVRGVA